MQREAEQKRLQQSIDSGEVDSVDELQTWMWRRGWRMHATKRYSKKSSRKIMVVSPGVDRGFQVEVPFDINSFDFQNPGIWIYGLLARSAESKASYIGQTASVMRRMAEHVRRSRSERGSGPFFKWAEQNKAEVHVIMLELSKRAPSKGETARSATVLEGSWLNAAIMAGYQAPGIEKWGQLPVSLGHKRSFDEREIWRAAKPFEDVIQLSLPLKHFWLGLR